MRGMTCLPGSTSTGIPRFFFSSSAIIKYIQIMPGALKARIQQKLLSQRDCEGSKEQKLRNDLQLVTMLNKFQSVQTGGYFEFEGWMQLNGELFAHVPLRTTRQLWKILRIINYGEVHLPTGLVYEVLHCLSNRSSTTLREVINDFLAMNEVTDSVNSFRELFHYDSLEDVQLQYRLPAPTGSKVARKHLFDNLHKDAKRKQIQLIQQKYQSIVEATKECNFTPSISQYHPPQPIKPRMQQPAEVRVPQPPFPFKAKQAERVLEALRGEIELEEVAGVSEHVWRNRNAQAEKRRIQRKLR